MEPEFIFLHEEVNAVHYPIARYWTLREAEGKVPQEELVNAFDFVENQSR